MTIAVFLIVYVGMILGRLPWLAIDRVGVALLGAILLVASGELTSREAWEAVDTATIALLFGLMVVSAQLRLGGFYTWITHRIVAVPATPPRLLFAVVALSGLLSALLVNDVVCLAMTPVLIGICVRRGLDPVPFLLGLAAAANVGSAATLIGNPQNMLVGQRLGVSFTGYLLDSLPPVLVGLAATWAVLVLAWRGRWQRELTLPAAPEPPFDAWQATKGVGVLLALVVLFSTAAVPREVAALVGAGLLLLSRRMHSREMLGLVDWQLCVLFGGLFVVNEALWRSGGPQATLEALQAAGWQLSGAVPLFVTTALLSNVVSNVPAVMLLLPVSSHPQAGPILALASTMAGNLFLVGSIANLIVVEQARRLGIEPVGGGWFRTHLRVGLPITLLSLAASGAWLALRAGGGGTG